MSVTIRHATAEDYPALPAVEDAAAMAFRAFGYDLVAEMEPTPASAYLELPDPHWVLVAETEAEIVGFCILLELDGEAHLKEFGVDHAWAGQGIGTAILEEAFRVVGAYRWITLTTFADLPFNAPYYQRLGFEVFTPDDTQPTLQAICAAERTGVLGQFNRVAMRKWL